MSGTEKAVNEKSNETTAISKVLEAIEIEGQVVTIEAMGTQTAIVDTIHGVCTDYVLAVIGNPREFGRGVFFAPLPVLETKVGRLIRI